MRVGDRAHKRRSADARSPAPGRRNRDRRAVLAQRSMRLGHPCPARPRGRTRDCLVSLRRAGSVLGGGVETRRFEPSAGPGARLEPRVGHVRVQSRRSHSRTRLNSSARTGVMGRMVISKITPSWVCYWPAPPHCNPSPSRFSWTACKGNRTRRSARWSNRPLNRCRTPANLASTAENR